MPRIDPLIASAAIALLASCSEHNSRLIDAPAVGQGLQLRMVSDLVPGVETERCQFFQVPPGGYNITREEVAFTTGSHHVLLYSTPYAEIPSKDLFGNPVDTAAGKWFECGTSGPTAHWSVHGVVGGSQNHEGVSFLEQLPKGVALRVPGNTVLLMNTHYINATSKVIQTDARINIFTIPDAEVKQEAGILFFYNEAIRIPANGQGTARLVCPIGQDISLANGQSHMHKRGVKQETHLLDVTGARVETLYAGTRWEDVAMEQYRPAKLLEAGQAIDYHCEYKNDEARIVTQGLSTKDEMCMFIGAYYPRHRETESCAGGRWVGNGTKNGAETAACLMTAGKDEAFYGCIVDSCSAISIPMSEAVRCFGSGGGGQCVVQCETSAAACNACIEQTCEPAMQALAAAACQ